MSMVRMQAGMCVMRAGKCVTRAWTLNFWWILNKSGSDEAKEDKKILSSMSLSMKSTIHGTHGKIPSSSIKYCSKRVYFIPSTLRLPTTRITTNATSGALPLALFIFIPSFNVICNIVQSSVNIRNRTPDSLFCYFLMNKKGFHK